MYAASSIRFTNPFASNNTPKHLDGDSWYKSAPCFDPTRILTPPPEMNGAGQHTTHTQHAKEPIHIHNENSSNQPSHKLPDNGMGSIRTEARRNLSILGLSPKSVARRRADSRKRQEDSQASQIKESFQIPRTVNDSGGSLAELAAQITCLFWFESSDILRQVEELDLSAQSIKQLVPDARPTTGFRKWVTTILSTTLVAQNVVLLALLFIYRLKKLNPQVRGKPGSEYRLLTVALMLGNKFLDDNTYTNKTWAEVSGINVQEVHIMEVEFLSNTKYSLFISADDWTEWQTLLGKFAAFFESATRPRPVQPPATILPPASSLHLPMALPSPPASNQASPPYALSPYQGANSQNGPTPAPSPLKPQMYQPSTSMNSRKRGQEDYSRDPSPKRAAIASLTPQVPQHQGSSQYPRVSSHIPRLTLPSLAIPAIQNPSGLGVSAPQAQQLPPLNATPGRAMAMVYPSMSTQPPSQQMLPVTAPPSQSQPQIHSQYQSRHQSPYPGSGNASPSGAYPSSAASLHPPVEVSPTYFLQQRNSPYRAVHPVSTLLHPPPSSAIQSQPPNVEYSQMHYQPLGKPLQQRQPGRLPYVSQNVWLEDNGQQAMTPVHQWPSFMNTHHQRHLVSQQ